MQPPGRRALDCRVTGSHGPGESARGSRVGRSADAGQNSQRDLLRVAALAGTCPMESERASHRQEMPSRRFRLQIAGPPRNRPVPGRATAGWQRPQNDGARNAGASGCVRRRLRLGPSHGEPVRKGQPASAVRVPESCPMRPARASHRLRVPSRQRLHFSSGWTRAVIAGTESYRAVPRPRTHGTVKRSLWVANTR